MDEMARHEFDTDSLSFRFDVDGDEHSARISGEALMDHFGAPSLEPLDLINAYRGNSVAIEAAAVLKARSGEQVPLLRSADF